MKYVPCLCYPATSLQWPRNLYVLGLAKELRQKYNDNKNQKQKTDDTTIETKGIKSRKVPKLGDISKFSLNQNTIYEKYKLRF